MPVQCICERCGNSFLSYPSRIAVGKARFCSVACKWPIHYRLCLYCGDLFTIAPSRIEYGYGKFCSYRCAYDAHAIGPAPRPVAERFWEKVEVRGPDDCWLWQAGKVKKGYGLFQPKHGTQVLAHRFSYELAHGPIPDGLWVLHCCDCPPCVNPRHLFLGDALENVRDATRKGRMHWQIGTQNPRYGVTQHLAKLTDESVLEIRRLRGKVTLRVLAERFGVSKHTISQAQKGQTWKHLPL